MKKREFQRDVNEPKLTIPLVSQFDEKFVARRCNTLKRDSRTRRDKYFYVYYRGSCLLTFDVINLISPWSAFTIRFASRRFSIFVECLGSSNTGCTPSSILNCEKVESSFLSCSIAFCDSVLSCLVITAIQDGILSFNCRNGAVTAILETPDCLVWRNGICEGRFANVSSMHSLLSRLL